MLQATDLSILVLTHGYLWTSSPVFLLRIQIINLQQLSHITLFFVVVNDANSQ